jgi:hypothetical protein
MKIIKLCAIINVVKESWVMKRGENNIYESEV